MLRWPLPSVVSVAEPSRAPVKLTEGGGPPGCAGVVVGDGVVAGVTVTELLLAFADPYALAAVTEHETACPPSADTVVYEAEVAPAIAAAPRSHA